MSRRAKNVKITAAVSPKVDEEMRLRAVKERLSLGELLEKYQAAYVEKLEREKAEKRAKKQEKSKEE